MTKDQTDKIIKCLLDMHFAGCCDPDASAFKCGQGVLAGDMVILLSKRHNSQEWKSAMRSLKERTKNL